jgi:hypothetical protein
VGGGGGGGSMWNAYLSLCYYSVLCVTWVHYETYGVDRVSSHILKSIKKVFVWGFLYHATFNKISF